MKYRNLGNCGLKVSEVCLGTMTFGHGADQPDSKRMVDLALDRGVNFFDTADTYADARSEVFLGKALKGRRNQAVVATKFFNATGPGPNDSGMSRYHIMDAIEGSLQRLGMDHVDIYYIHHVDDETPIEEMLRAVDDLVHQGKVRYVACSNYQAWRLGEALWISETKNLSRFVCYQPQYSLVVRDIEQELLPLCRAKGLGVVVWSPLAGGYLTGKYKPGRRVLSGTRSEESWAYPERYFAANADETMKALLAAAETLGCSPARLAIRWVLERPLITSAIVGARSAEQLSDNLGALELHPDPSVLADLEEVSRLQDRYPESMEKGMRARRSQAVKMPDA